VLLSRIPLVPGSGLQPSWICSLCGWKNQHIPQMVGFHGDLTMVESAKKSLRQQIQACNSGNFNHISKPWHLCKKKGLYYGWLISEIKTQEVLRGCEQKSV